MKIILLGYMASGKSTIGRKLSDELNVSFIDLDKYIEEQEKKSISTIFNKDGEIYFRLKEHQYLKELLQKEEDFILALGGGTPCYANNMDVITLDESSVSVYLQASIKTITNRLNNGKSNRPLIANLSEEDMLEFVAKHLFERSFFYEQANVKVKVDNKSEREINNEIKKLLRQINNRFVF